MYGRSDTDSKASFHEMWQVEENSLDTINSETGFLSYRDLSWISLGMDSLLGIYGIEQPKAISVPEGSFVLRTLPLLQ